jgi:hypothetical protein
MTAPVSYDLICPVPTGETTKCATPLHLMWTASRGLSAADVANPTTTGPEDAWVQSWTVECERGHVVMVPGDPGCKHPDEIAEQPDHVCDVDASEEFREFRISDADRLFETLRLMNQAGTPL